MPENLRKEAEKYIFLGIDWSIRFRFDSKGTTPNPELDCDFFQKLLAWEDEILGLRDSSRNALYAGDKFRKAPIVKEVFKRKFPSLKKSKNHPISGGTTYELIWQDLKFFISADHSTWGNNFSLDFGFVEPWLMFDIMNFFGGGQSRFSADEEEQIFFESEGQRFRSFICREKGPEEFRKAVEESADLVEELLPHVYSIIANS
jgi:hypothetical protein